MHCEDTSLYNFINSAASLHNGPENEGLRAMNEPRKISLLELLRF